MLPKVPNSYHQWKTIIYLFLLAQLSYLENRNYPMPGLYLC